MKTITVLALALSISLLGNAVGLYRAGHARAAQAASLDKARLQGAVEALQSRADAINHVALAATADGQKLQAELRSLNATAAAGIDGYRRFVAGLPALPHECGPGAARVEAFNRATGAAR